MLMMPYAADLCVQDHTNLRSSLILLSASPSMHPCLDI